MALKDELKELLKEPKKLQECYDALPEHLPHSIRARLNESVGKCFKRVGKGIYLAINGETQALILEGDSWERIKEIEDGSIDFIITDSPQTTAHRWAAMGTTRKKENKLSYDLKDMDAELYRELNRVLKKGGHMFLFFNVDTEHTLDYNNKQIELARQQGFVFNKRFIWDKMMIGMGYNGRCKYEQMFFLSKGERHKPYDLGIPDLLSHKRPSHLTRVHESEKPVELLQDLIKIAGKKGDVGMDCFAGSFNFVEACQRQGCHSITIEKSAEFVQKAVARFNAQVVEE
jgi:site-specific DNA-methyltransferase (adenine-specific)